MQKEIIKYKKKVEKINKNYREILFDKNRLLEEQKHAYSMIQLMNNFQEFLAELWLVISEYGVENKLIENMEKEFKKVKEKIYDNEKEFTEKDSCFYM